MRCVLMGIGNELNGDDGVGNIIARDFAERGQKGWLSLPCETVPENFTSVIRKEKPELLIIIDAAQMGLEPGELRLVPKRRLGSDVLGTHGIPLRHLVSCLGKHAKEILFVGVQPGRIAFGEEGLSAPVEKAKERLMGILQRGEWGKIARLG